jgi:hypothetical protein
VPAGQVTTPGAWYPEELITLADVDGALHQAGIEVTERPGTALSV